jgi:hypothetical protein
LKSSVSPHTSFKLLLSSSEGFVATGVNGN